MENDKEFRGKLLFYIKANEKNYAKENLDNLTITELTIIKAAIEIKLHYKKKK